MTCMCPCHAGDSRAAGHSWPLCPCITQKMASRKVLIVVCKVCGGSLIVKHSDSWLEHHDDGSHTFHPGTQPSAQDHTDGSGA